MRRFIFHAHSTSPFTATTSSNNCTLPLLHKASLRNFASREKLSLLQNAIRVAGADVRVELGELAKILPADRPGRLGELK